MKIDADLLSNPLFIIKKLQRDAFRQVASVIKGRVLDIGCGIQPYRRYILCDEYVGIDGLYGVNPKVCAIAGNLPFRDASFDSVLCTEVLEHLESPQTCIAEIKRVLKSGGRAYITSPQSWPLHYEPYDYWRFTKYGLYNILVEHEFKVITVKRIGGAFTLIGQEIIDVAWTLLRKSLSFIGSRWAERLSTGLCAPLSVLIYLCGRIADHVDKRYALGWAMVVIK